MVMEKTKIVIDKVIPAKKGSSFLLKSGFTILPPTEKDLEPLIVSYSQISETPAQDDLRQEEEEKKVDEQKRKEAIKEFQSKWQIRPGSFYLNVDEGWSEIPKEDEKYYETGASKKLERIFELFFAKKEVAEKFKKMKRAYLLHSEPGMGKSALIRHFCKNASKKQGTAVLKVEGDINFSILTKIFIGEYQKNVERIILVIEDFGKKDYLVGSNIYNPSCLNFLDGNISLFRVPTLIITTTNYLVELGPQLTSRPGRFNKIILVEPPKDEEVFELVENFSGLKLTDKQKEAFSGKNFSPDYCIEAVVRSEFEDLSIEEAVNELLNERAISKKY
jgi:SpoVK/Ycf46/Vps4 family AAA+-type ATPase